MPRLFSWCSSIVLKELYWKIIKIYGKQDYKPHSTLVAKRDKGGLNPFPNSSFEEKEM